MTNWKTEHFGVGMLVASLVVIAITAVLLLQFQANNRKQSVQEQGVSLSRLLASLPYEQLAPENGRNGLVEILKYSLNNQDFAYAVVEDPRGQPQVQISTPGLIIPSLQAGAEDNWQGSRHIPADQGSRGFYEFHATILSQGQRKGRVRVGYYEPDLAFLKDQIPFFAMLALPIFCLTPIFYLLMKRSIKPLLGMNAQIASLLEKQPLPKDTSTTTGDLSDFVNGFNRVIQLMDQRRSELESQRTLNMASTKVISYKKQRIEQALHALPDAILLMDENGASTFINQKAQRLLNVSDDQVIAHKTHEWCKDEEILAFLALYQHKTARLHRSEVLEYVRGDPARHIRVTAFPLSGAAPGQAGGVMVIFRDTTAEIASKQASGEFIAHIAHEVKTPLNVLTMYSEMLLGEQGKTEEFRVEAVNVIHDEVERMSNLIHNLLNISKIESGNLAIDRQRVKLRELLQDVYENIRRSGRGAELNFKLQVPHELSAISADKELLRIAINNLMTNAIKYNKPGGVVVLGGEEDDDEIRISVRDSGIGIARKDQGLLFNKFFRSDDPEVRNRSGHGLGLALTKNVIDLHQGSIDVHSETGQGTEFVIRFKKDMGILKKAL